MDKQLKNLKNCTYATEYDEQIDILISNLTSQ